MLTPKNSATVLNDISESTYTLDRDLQINNQSNIKIIRLIIKIKQTQKSTSVMIYMDFWF